MHATSMIIMLRCYGWWWEDSVENIVRVLDSFIKQLIVSVLAQFFKHEQMHCVVSGHLPPFATTPANIRMSLTLP